MSKVESEINLAPKTIAFIQEHLLDYPLLGVLQVGSSARGYALDNSDVDLMAFYDVPSTFRAYPNHTSFEGQRITIEHHGLAGFLTQNCDFRVNLGSLRQLYKVRDGIVIFGDVEKLAFLRKLADQASLDPKTLLHLLAKISLNILNIQIASLQVQHQTLIGWTEILSTLRIASTHCAPAYSKPKWLLRMLVDAKRSDAYNLIHLLYGERSDKSYLAREIILNLYDLSKKQGLQEKHERLLSTAINDATQLIQHCPEQSGPATRFAVFQIWRATYGETPIDALKRRESLSSDVFLTIGSDDIGDIQLFWDHFLDFAQTLFHEVRSECLNNSNTTIGTTRFVTHLLDAYQSTEIFPYTSELQMNQWIDQCEKVLMK